MEFLPRTQVRTIAEQKMGRSAGTLRTLSFGKGRVVFSQLDITTGLLGTNTWGVVGYQSGYAQSLLKNLILWTVDGCPDTPDGRVAMSP
ncbi:MAG TPA: hypothetical protein VHP11_01960 [Tepidisphaeraceae bacterium]|nr:hypothetical protein [Tepidisphaeraceae bacterium]